MFTARACISQNQMQKDNGLYVLIGQAEDGAVHFCDITKAPHIFVGGCTGTGKSVFLHGVIFSLLLNYNPQEVKVALIDTKHTEFGVYKNVPHLAYGVDENICVVLEGLENEMELRVPLVQNGSKWQGQRIVVIIDEYACLTTTDKERVEKLVRLGHGVGIHVITATQRFTGECVSPIIKACSPTIVAFYVATKRDSLSLFGRKDVGAERLKGKGDGLYQDKAGRVVHLQTGYVSNKDIEEIAQTVIEKYAKEKRGTE